MALYPYPLVVFYFPIFESNAGYFNKSYGLLDGGGSSLLNEMMTFSINSTQKVHITSLITSKHHRIVSVYTERAKKYCCDWLLI